MAASTLKMGGDIFVEETEERVQRTAHKTVRKAGKGDKNALSSRKLFGELDTNRKNREGREVLRSEKKAVKQTLPFEGLEPKKEKVRFIEDAEVKTRPDVAEFIRGGWRDDEEEIEGPAGGMTGRQYAAYLKAQELKREQAEEAKFAEEAEADPPIEFDTDLPWLRKYKNPPKPPPKVPATFKVAFSPSDIPDDFAPDDRSNEIGPPIIEDFAFEIDEDLQQLCDRHRASKLDGTPSPIIYKTL